MFPQREEVSYINNQTGEELTEEEIKEFDKFSTMKELNDDMLEMIDKGLSDDNKKLLYKNPELFLSNDKYRARTERPEGSISVKETLILPISMVINHLMENLIIMLVVLLMEILMQKVI